MSTRRTLRLLALLQRPRWWSATELAERLETSTRTIRRDVDRLRTLGYPVEATMGSAGGYRLGAGGEMPPLVLDDDEAVAVVVGLRVAAAHAVEGIDEASVRALAKILQVVPKRVRHRVGALARLDWTTLATGSPTVDPDDLTRLAAAVEGAERVRFTYEAPGDAPAERRVEPHGVVALANHWYLVGYDVDRDDWRTFRLDRLRNLAAIGGRGASPPLPGTTAADYLTATMRNRAAVHEAIVLVEAPATEVKARLADAVADVEALGGNQCRCRLAAETAPWIAARLGTLHHDSVSRDHPRSAPSSGNSATDYVHRRV